MSDLIETQSDWQERLAQCNHSALDPARIIDHIQEENGVSRSMVAAFEDELAEDYPLNGISQHPSQTGRTVVEKRLTHLSRQGLIKTCDLIDEIYQTAEIQNPDNPEPQDQESGEYSPEIMAVRNVGQDLILLDAYNKKIIKCLVDQDEEELELVKRNRDSLAKVVVDTLSINPAVGQHHTPNQALCAFSEAISAHSDETKSQIRYELPKRWPTVDTEMSRRQIQALKKCFERKSYEIKNLEETEQKSDLLNQIAYDVMALHAYKHLCEHYR